MCSSEKQKQHYKPCCYNKNITREHYFSMGFGESILHECFKRYTTPAFPITHDYLRIWPDILFYLTQRIISSWAVFMFASLFLGCSRIKTIIITYKVTRNFRKTMCTRWWVTETYGLKRNYLDWSHIVALFFRALGAYRMRTCTL